MSDLMKKFLNGELTEFEAERLERELESVEMSEHFSEMAQVRYAELEVQAAKSAWRRSAEYWAAWFGRASMAAVTRASLVSKLAAAAALGMGAGAAGYALLQSGLLDKGAAEVLAQAPADLPQASGAAAEIKAASLKAPMQTSKKSQEAAHAEAGVVLDVLKTSAAAEVAYGNLEVEEGEPILEGYDPETGNMAAAAKSMAEDLTIELHLDNSRYVSVQIVDTNGSLTRTVHTGQLPKGTWFFFLDQKDKNWRDMPAGAYFVEVNVGEQRLRRDFSVSSHQDPANGV